VGQPHQPLLCTALKPMGYSPKEIAGLARGFALGGVDIIKDDHGLSNQPFCPFEERVRACVAAVAQANAESGHRSLYAPNVTAPFPLLVERARFAAAEGAGALLVAPGLTGFDAMRHLAADPHIGLPILAHPALLGSAVTGGNNGFSHAVLFGTLQRLAGADVSIFPNYGGRFGFSREECAEIAGACQTPLGGLASIFPSPGGGMTLDRVPDMLELYGEDVMFLIGGGLYGHSPDLAANTRYFLGMVGR
jgi:ribulose-bisphosphate carboxylase large chain